MKVWYEWGSWIAPLIEQYSIRQQSAAFGGWTVRNNNCQPTTDYTGVLPLRAFCIFRLVHLYISTPTTPPWWTLPTETRSSLRTSNRGPPQYRGLLEVWDGCHGCEVMHTVRTEEITTTELTIFTHLDTDHITIRWAHLILILHHAVHANSKG